MFSNIDIDEKTEFNVMEMLQTVIVDGFIESLRDGKIDLDDGMLTSYLAVAIKTDKDIDFLKALGLAKFKDNRDACLVINDFCAFLKDTRAMGEQELRD